MKITAYVDKEPELGDIVQVTGGSKGQDIYAATVEGVYKLGWLMVKRLDNGQHRLVNVGDVKVVECEPEEAA
jgi:hypothetical protein